MKNLIPLLFPLFLFFSACSSDDINDAVDLAEGVDRKPIDVSRMGLNAFSNQGFAGSICAQFNDIASTLRLAHVRVLFNWDDNVQPAPGGSRNFSFYDDIIDCVPPGVSVLVILTNTPSWMNNQANWIDGNPRLTFVRNWVRRVANRYKGNRKIIGYQIWNEPDNAAFGENQTLQVLSDPLNFVELVSLAYDEIKAIDPGKLVINGATTSIAQKFPDTLNYNQALRDAGIESVVDRYAIHYYGNNFEALVSDVENFLNALVKPIWVTESGKQGVNEQLPYVETVWPFLRENVPGVDRIYYYRYAEATPSDVTFGLLNPDPEFPVSDLYIFLRDR